MINNCEEEIILGAFEKYSKEILFSEIKSHKSYARMFHKFESEVLYSLVRNQKPKKILEMGCYHGQTSNILIKAILSNGINCELISSDLLDYSKYMDYDNGQTSRKLILGDSKITITKEIGEIDFLFIDSDHTYDFAKWYCDVVIPLVKKGSFVMVHDWEGIEGDKDDEFRSIIENAINNGMLKRCMNLMEYTKSHPNLSLTPRCFRYAVGDRNPSEILIRI